MNILYISNLSNTISAGPSWSVPESVKAQQKYDNVLWVDCNAYAYQKHWSDVEAYHNIKEYKSPFRISNLKEPFNKPDLIVFEGFYHQYGLKIAKEARCLNIPYIIIPRGSLTCKAQNNHSWLKKRIANFFFYQSFCKHALLIQYLTKKEFEDSGLKWCKNYFILPNGFRTPSIVKQKFSSKGIKAIYIGRKDLYHKGLDVLIDAIYDLKDLLIQNEFKLLLYGPIRDDHDKISDIIKEKGLDEIVENMAEIGGQAKEQALLNSDLFILTSRFEGHPMGLIEALAYGLPSLVSTGSNMRNEIELADAGWCCDTNLSSIKDALLQIIREKALFSIKGKKAKELAANYDWELLAEKFHYMLLDKLSL